MLKWVIGILVLIGGGVWLLSGRGDLPGNGVADQGKEHWDRAKLDEFKYNSNPPTSGPHDPDWIRPGRYDVAQDKYKLIHSLEHGYVVVHYNCAKPLVTSDQYSVVSVRAHEDEGDLDGDSATPSAVVAFNCETGKILAEFAKKIELKRIIVQPNPEIDKPIVITAWNKKLVLDKWDEEAAASFARAYHNKGPEQTVE